VRASAMSGFCRVSFMYLCSCVTLASRREAGCWALVPAFRWSPRTQSGVERCSRRTPPREASSFTKLRKSHPTRNRHQCPRAAEDTAPLNVVCTLTALRGPWRRHFLSPQPPVRTQPTSIPRSIEGRVPDAVSAAPKRMPNMALCPAASRRHGISLAFLPARKPEHTQGVPVVHVTDSTPEKLEPAA
jgi:hypothetical protein